VQGSRAVVKLLPAGPGGTEGVLVGGLPLGQANFTAEAFAQTCSTIGVAQPLWVSDTRSAFVRVDPPVEVDLVFQRNGRAAIFLIFHEDPDGGIPDAAPRIITSFSILSGTAAGTYPYTASVVSPPGSPPTPPPPTSGAALLVATSNPPAADDGCNPLPAGSLMGRVALIRRGTCTFLLKDQNAAAAGAVAVVIDDSVPNEALTPAVNGGPIPLVAITKELGDRIRAGTLPVVLQWNPPITVDP
jgi:hypothetical protein